jgi:CBS domain-containing protein
MVPLTIPLPPADYLRKIEPFSFLSESELKEIISGLESEIYGKGKTIFKKGGKPLKYVYFLKSGVVELKNDETVEILTERDIFGIVSAITGNPPRFTAKAKEDSVCYLIRRENFLKVFNSNQKFSEFFTKLMERRLVSFFKLSRKNSNSLDGLCAAPVSSLISRDPVVCSPDTSILDVARIMSQNNVGSVVVVNGKRAIGIFTQRDLTKLIASQVPLDEKVGKYMSAPVIELDENSTIMEAYLEMVTNAINHLVVVNDGEIKGVISTKDLLIRLESSSSLLYLSRRIIRADISELKNVVESAKSSIEDLVSKVDFPELARISTGICDLVVKRVIELTEKNFDLPDYCWFQTGDLGRRETINMDQSGSIMFEGNEKQIREFANTVCSTLDSIGIPHSQFSAKQWCYSLDEWKEIMERWSYNPEKHISEISIFMDSRFLIGNKKIYLQWLNAFSNNVTKKTVRAMISNALNGKGLASCLLEGIKALCLNAKIFDAKSMQDRCEDLLKMNLLPKELGREVLEAYSVMSEISLRNQIGYPAGKVEEILLKESVKIVSRFQEFLKAMI